MSGLTPLWVCLTAHDNAERAARRRAIPPSGVGRLAEEEEEEDVRDSWRLEEEQHEQEEHGHPPLQLAPAGGEWPEGTEPLPSSPSSSASSSAASSGAAFERSGWHREEGEAVHGGGRYIAHGGKDSDGAEAGHQAASSQCSSLEYEEHNRLDSEDSGHWRHDDEDQGSDVEDEASPVGRGGLRATSPLLEQLAGDRSASCPFHHTHTHTTHTHTPHTPHTHTHIRTHQTHKYTNTHT